MTMTTGNWALVDETGRAVNDERFATQADAHMGARGTAQGPRRLDNGQPMLVGRTVWTAQVDANGMAS